MNRFSEELVTGRVNDDLTLVDACKNGDVTAFEELVKRYDRKLLRIALSILHSKEDAEEAVQDAFFKAYRNLNQFQGNARFSTWLIRIVINESLMKLRKKHRAIEVSLDPEPLFDGDVLPLDTADWGPDPEEQYVAAELREILTKALQELRPTLRIVIVLRDVEGLSINETADVLNLTQSAVKARLFRARLELRERLSKYFRNPARVDVRPEPGEELEWAAKALAANRGDDAATTRIGV